MSQRTFIGIASALLFHLLVPPAEAQGKDSGDACRSLIVGGYLSTIKDNGGNIAGRSLLSFDEDGAVDVIDSDQFSGTFDSAFSAQKGRYRCTGRRSVSAYTLDFGFSGDGDIGLEEYRFDIGPDGSLSGDLVLTILTPLQTCNPFDPATCNVEAVFEFTLTAVPMPD